MQIKDYFDKIQEWIKENIEDKSQIDNIIKYLNKDNIQAVVNKDYHGDVSVEECAKKLLDNYDEQGEIQDVAQNTLGGDRGNNKLERKNHLLKYMEFINESYYPSKAWIAINGLKLNKLLPEINDILKINGVKEVIRRHVKITTHGYKIPIEFKEERISPQEITAIKSGVEKIDGIKSADFYGKTSGLPFREITRKIDEYETNKIKYLVVVLDKNIDSLPSKNKEEKS